LGRGSRDGGLCRHKAFRHQPQAKRYH
jgi:hypothetical protein